MAKKNLSKKITENTPSLAVVKSVGWVTFLEITSDKILYNIVLCALLLMGLGFLASRLMFVRPVRVVLDFGLSTLMISSAMIATFTGASLIGREFEKRTIFVALSRPISRFQFILGKYAGLVGVLLVNWVLMALSYFIILLASGAEWGELFNQAMGWALALAFFQSLMIGAIAILFSTFSTTSLSVIMTIGLYLVGNNISQIRLVATRLKSPMGSTLLNGLASILPNLEYFSLSTKVTYGLPVSLSFGLTSLAYGTVLSIFFLLGAGVLISRREG